jgi:hypothetical protein
MKTDTKDSIDQFFFSFLFEEEEEKTEQKFAHVFGRKQKKNKRPTKSVHCILMPFEIKNLQINV